MKKQKTFRILLLLTICIVIFFNYLLLIAPERWTSNNAELKGNKAMPPSLVLITVALGPIRGLIADALWWHVSELQEKSEYFEIIKITDWITALQPKNPYVWTYHAWNMAYNIAYEFPTAKTRWGWINNGIKLLRDEGLNYNPSNNFIKSELAWILVDRIGGKSDNQSHYYVRKWTEIMSKYLKNGNRKEIIQMIDFIAKHAEYREEKTPEATKINKLETTLKLKPEKMLGIDKQYGPFNWLLPQASAVYWGARKENKEYSQGYLNYKVILPVAMQQAFLRGSIVENPKNGLFITTNNFAIAPNIIKMYEEKAKSSKKPKLEQANALVFLKNAIPILFSFQQMETAKILFDEYQRLRNIKVNISSFYQVQIKRLQDKGAARYKQSMIEISLFSAYRSLLDNTPEKTANFTNYAEKEWHKHQLKYGHTTLRLEPFDSIKAAAFCKAFLSLKTKTKKEALLKLASSKQTDKLIIKDIEYLKFNGVLLRKK